uniref:Uncharacterized protein n=1 Tax=Rhizophora mucronata TaxID=61149 RepID=A0A2P2K2A5_RHIMU
MAPSILVLCLFLSSCQLVLQEKFLLPVQFREKTSLSFEPMQGRLKSCEF